MIAGARHPRRTRFDGVVAVSSQEMEVGARGDDVVGVVWHCDTCHGSHGHSQLSRKEFRNKGAELAVELIDDLQPEPHGAKR